MRAIAMAAVIALHCGILPFGWMGVWLFYVISGYVVTRSLLEGKTNAVGFYVHRAARIWPIYFLYVAVAFSVSSIASGAPEWTPLLSLVFFYNNFEAAFGDGFLDHFSAGHLGRSRSSGNSTCCSASLSSC